MQGAGATGGILWNRVTLLSRGAPGGDPGGQGRGGRGGGEGGTLCQYLEGTSGGAEGGRRGLGGRKRGGLWAEFEGYQWNAA